MKKREKSEELVTIATFMNLIEAQMAKAELESYGITCFVLNENMGRMDMFNLIMDGGMPLKVPASQADQAISILNSHGDIEEDNT